MTPGSLPSIPWTAKSFSSFYWFPATQTGSQSHGFYLKKTDGLTLKVLLPAGYQRRGTLVTPGQKVLAYSLPSSSNLLVISALGPS